MANEPSAPSGVITAGDPAGAAEVALRADNARLDQENRELRGKLSEAGVTLPAPRERRFVMSEGIRQDLIMLRHRVESGELKEEDAAVTDPATGAVFTLDDLPADAAAIPGVGAPEVKPASRRKSNS